MAMMQEKLTACKEEIAKLNESIGVLKERLTDKQLECNNYWMRWQCSQFNGEEAMLRLNNLSENFNSEMDIKRQNADAYERLHNSYTRCDRLMKYQGREVMRVTFKAN